MGANAVNNFSNVFHLQPWPRLLHALRRAGERCHAGSGTGRLEKVSGAGQHGGHCGWRSRKIEPELRKLNLGAVEIRDAEGTPISWLQGPAEAGPYDSAVGIARRSRPHLVIGSPESPECRTLLRREPSVERESHQRPPDVVLRAQRLDLLAHSLHGGVFCVGAQEDALQELSISAILRRSAMRAGRSPRTRCPSVRPAFWSGSTPAGCRASATIEYRPRRRSR